MPYVPFKTLGFFSLKEAARQCNVDANRLWRLVYEKNLVPAPAARRGARVFYDAEQMAAVRETIEALRRDGQLK